MPETRSGIGFDVHRSADDRELWLGCVRFGGEAGLVGHSDGDVVSHAIADALLGAVALGDIGEHFPETAPATAGISGSEVLRATASLLRAADHEPWSVDVTVICERPVIGPRRDENQERAGRRARDGSRPCVREGHTAGRSRPGG